MQLRIIFLAVVVLLLPVGSSAQSPEAQPTRTYIPGIEQFMNVIQSEHAKLWFAGSASNWELAAYQLGEIKEIMSDVEDLYPTFKNLPLGKMLDAVITGQIDELEKALDAKDMKAFAAGYDKLTEACNSCHEAAENGFVVIQRPAGAAFPNQDFKPRN